MLINLQRVSLSLLADMHAAAVTLLLLLLLLLFWWFCCV
jgi:hypothetical protein